MFRKIPFILMAMILAIVFLNSFIPLGLKELLYTISLSIKSIIVFILPIIIFGLLFRTTVNLANSATRVIILILVAVCFSNFISTLLSHNVGMWIYQFDLSIILPEQGKSLQPLWNFEIPKLIANDKAMFAGLILGILGGIFKKKIAIIVANRLERLINLILSSFTYIIPLFVAGFVIKLQFDGMMSMIVKDYALIFGIIAMAQFSYIGFIYLIANNFKIRALGISIKNMLPALIAGFSTMSSAAAMPLTIIGTEKNAANKDLARAIIPSTVNIHLIGDCFAIPIFAYAVLKNYGMAEPAFFDYLLFAFYFVLAKFSVAAIPGGGIIVMLPILEKYLGFNGEMMSVITALYILFDPVITCANVAGNGGFALVISKLGILRRKKEKATCISNS